MAKSKTAIPTTRAPRGTKIVAEAFFTAVDQIPELQRAGVVKAALALIRDRLKESRDKAKLAKEKQKGQRAPAPTKAVAPPKTASRKAVASANVKKPPAKAAKRVKAPPLKAPERQKVCYRPRISVLPVSTRQYAHHVRRHQRVEFTEATSEGAIIKTNAQFARIARGRSAIPCSAQ